MDNKEIDDKEIDILLKKWQHLFFMEFQHLQHNILPEYWSAVLTLVAPLINKKCEVSNWGHSEDTFLVY